jgi:hypothetical protein
MGSAIAREDGDDRAEHSGHKWLVNTAKTSIAVLETQTVGQLENFRARCETDCPFVREKAAGRSMVQSVREQVFISVSA